jgi:hypothetical protein
MELQPCFSRFERLKMVKALPFTSMVERAPKLFLLAVDFMVHL